MKSKSVFQILIFIGSCTLFVSCFKQKDNTIFNGYQIGSWSSTDLTQTIQGFIFQDSINSVIITPDVVIGNPELYGEHNKSGIRSFFNFNVDPIEFNQVYYDNEGEALDTNKYFIQFASMDTMLMTKNKGKTENKNYFTNNTDTIYTFIKTDTVSIIPQGIIEITETINKLYSNFSYDIEAIDNIDTEKIPIYGNIYEISIGLGMIRMFTMNYSFEAENIRILKLTEKEATVSYNLLFIENSKNIKVKEVTVNLKKINNQWRVFWKDIFGTGSL